MKQLVLRAKRALKGPFGGGVAASILALLPGLSFAAPDLTPTTIGGIDFFEYEKGIFTLLQDDQSTSTQTTWTGCFAITGATLIMKSNSFGMLYQSIAADGDTGTFSIGSSSKVQIIGGDQVGTNAITHMANSNGQATIINYGVLELIGGEGQNVHGIGSVGAYGGIGTINNEDGATMLVQGGFYSDTTEDDMSQDSNGIGANARYGGTGHINNKGSGTITFIGGPGTNSNGMHHNAVNENSVGYIVNEGTGSIVFQGGAVLRANGVSSNAYGAGATAYILNNGTGEIKIIGGSYNATDLNEGTEGLSTNAYGGAQGTISNNAGGTIGIYGGTGSWAVGMASNAQEEGSVGAIVNNEGTLIIQGGSGESSTGLYQNAVLNAQGTITNKGESLKIQGGSGKSAFGLASNGDRANGLIENVGSGELLIIGGTGEGTSGLNANARGENGVGNIINRADGNITIQGGSGVNAHGMDVNANSATASIVNEGNGQLSIIGGSSDKVYGIGYNSTSSASGTILNSGDGELLISGGSAQQAIGLVANEYQNATKATIENSGKGNLTISGGTGVSAYGMGWNSNGGQNGLISNSGTGNLIIVGGEGENANGLYQNASDGVGSIINSSSGTLRISAGVGKGAHGISENALNNGTGYIENTGGGQLIIEGSATSYAFGVMINSRNGGTGYILNSGSGDLTIQGGSVESGIQANVYANGSGETIGYIKNTGEGTLKIIGGSDSIINGVEYNAYQGGTGVIANEGSGDLIIQGGEGGSEGISYNAYRGGTGQIINAGPGHLFIRGGSSSNAYGIGYNTTNGGVGLIRNIGEGTLKIEGSSSAEGIYDNERGEIRNENTGTIKILGSIDYWVAGIQTNNGSIVNSGAGTLLIQGGQGEAIGYNGDDSQGIGRISNTGTGTLTIQGGSQGYGIEWNASRGGTGIISNGVEGTLNILGAKRSGIHSLSGPNGTGRLENAGIMNLNSNAIDGLDNSTATGEIKSVSVINKSTGTVNAEVEAIFKQEKRTEEVYRPIPITVYSPDKGTRVEELDSYESLQSVTTLSEWQLKDDWYKYSTWEDGGRLVITDIAAGTEDALEITKAFQDRFGTGTTLEFTGIDAKGVVEAVDTLDATQPEFTISHVNEMIASGQLQDNEVITSEILYNESSTSPEGPSTSGDDGWTDDDREHTGGANALIEPRANFHPDPDPTDPVLPPSEPDLEATSLVVLDSTKHHQYGDVEITHDIDQSTGFKGVMGYKNVKVQDGRSLTLVGEQATMAMALRAQNASASFLLTDATVSVDANSTLKLGIADLSATQGYFEDLEMTDSSANLSVENGIFQITNVSGKGQINVQGKGELTISGNATAGDVVNKGVLNATAQTTTIGVAFEEDSGNSELLKETAEVKDVNSYEPGGGYGDGGNAGGGIVPPELDDEESKNNHFKTFTNEKGGEANFADVSITEGANVKNKAEATINAGSVVLDGGAVITNFADGTLNFDSFEMNGTLRNNGTINVASEMTLAEGTSTTLAGKVTAGTLSIGRAAQKAVPASIALLTEPQTSAEITGETYSNVLDLAGGDVFVRKDAILAGVELKDNIVNSHVTVDTDGTFAFSYNENQLEEALKNFKLDTDGKALAILSTDLSFGEEGSLTVGTTDANATVNLGSDALVLLGTDSLHGNAVLNGEGKETLNIKEGAELAFVDDAIWGNHYLIRDFAQTDDAANLVVKDKDGNVLEAHANDKGIYVTIGSNDITDKDEHFALVGNINSILDGMQDTSSELVDIRYLSQAMGAKDGVKQTNDLQHLSAQAGILSEAYRLTDNAHESIIRHAMSDKYSNVWVEALAGKGGVDGASTAYGDASYDSDSYGMIFGFDGRIGQDINVGAAIHYQKGDLDADSSQTKNEFKNYGASIYAATNFGKLNVTAGLTYAKGDHEFNQVNLGYVEGDTDTEIFMGGIRASYPIMLDRILITPYAGIEAVHVKEDGFKATIGGAEAFDFGSVSETFGRVPMGVKLSGSNLKFAGYADISVIPQFGNRDAKQSVSGVNTKATDVAKFDYADSVLGRVKMGAAYQVNKSTTLGVSYGASMGDVRDLSHEFSLNAKYRF